MCRATNFGKQCLRLCCFVRCFHGACRIAAGRWPPELVYKHQRHAETIDFLESGVRVAHVSAELVHKCDQVATISRAARTHQSL